MKLGLYELEFWDAARRREDRQANSEMAKKCLRVSKVVSKAEITVDCELV